jgi:chaperonin GroEL
MPTPRVISNPPARARLLRGFDTLARLLAATLGPTQRTVLSTSYQHGLPEALDDAATIARRFVALPDRAENAGAMLLRNLVWRQHQRCGDGCATAAVLARAILAEAQRYVAAGVDPTSLRAGIERAVTAAEDALQREARPLQGEDDLEHVARTLCGDARMGEIIAELFGLLGADAYITVESYAAPYLEREYLAGGRWKARLASPYLADAPGGELLLGPLHTVLHDGEVALFAGSVRALDDVLPLLEQVAQGERRRLLIVAQDFGDPALTTLVVNHQRGLAQVVAVELREIGARRRCDFEDLAALTGARLFAEDCGEQLGDISVEALGRVRRIEATDRDLLVSGARGGTAVRAQVEALRGRLGVAEDADERDELRARVGRLASGTATLQIGAATTIERDLARRRAERCLRAMPYALREGVLPGGGAAYIAIADALADLPACRAEAYGVAIVRKALEAPLRQIVANVGRRDPSAVLAEVRRYGRGWGYDGLNDTIMCMDEATILDPAGVLREALRSAASGAVLALSIESLVLTRNPETSFQP